MERPIRAESYKNILRLFDKLPDELKRKKVSAISPIELQAFINNMAENRSNSYIQKMLINIRAAFASAFENGICPRNPAAHLTAPHKKEAQREAYTVREAQKLTAFAIDYKRDNPQSGLYDTGRQTAVATLVMLYTGLRRGEALGLMWSDMADGRLSVNRSVFIALSYIFGRLHSTKSHKLEIYRERYEKLYAPFITKIYGGMMLEMDYSSWSVEVRGLFFDLFMRNLQYADEKLIALANNFHTAFLKALDFGENRSTEEWEEINNELNKNFTEITLAMLTEAKRLSKQLHMPDISEPASTYFYKRNSVRRKI
ncbi:hypothetical protein FACS1894217_11940 [Clostridia bacterium]|nr:hypothetical protein FACS1894217_11940 [Clostridia bacterium]